MRVAALMGALLVSACSLPSLLNRPSSSALPASPDARLARAVIPLTEQHPGKSGVHALPVPEEAFAVRGLLAAAAERSIDAQYYIWHDDVTGTLLFQALCAAADRGVRVRLLLDDNDTAGLDPTIAALAAHANIEVRLFNPLVNRRARWSNYLFDFGRINHRMHNKSFTVDNEVTVVGGRNIGDEYFNAGGDVTFADLDVVAIGPIVAQVSNSFDAFWNSASAYPAQSIVGAPAADAAARLAARFAASDADPRAKSYLESLRSTTFVAEIGTQSLAFEWSDVRLVADDPAKVFADDRELLLLPHLFEITGAPRREFDVVSPYFVPKDLGTVSFVKLAQQGVAVQVLTNSLESNDVAAVHAGYAKRRKKLLHGGVKLYELKATPLPGGRPSHSHSSSGALHAKTFQIDGKLAFVGSFNFDPRSARLNTEIGLVIESPAMAEQLHEFFSGRIRQRAYVVTLTPDDKIEWLETTPFGTTITYTSEPNASAMRRGMVDVLSVMPIDWLL